MNLSKARIISYLIPSMYFLISHKTEGRDIVIAGESDNKLLHTKVLTT